MTLLSPPRVELLAGFSLRLGDDPHSAQRDVPRAVQRLIARLSLSRCPDRSAIAGQLWPDVPEDHAHGSLRSALWRLREVAPGTVRVTGSALSLADGVAVDVRELDAWAAGVLDPHRDEDDLAVPGASMRGELLPGWTDDWVLLERERLRQLRMHALEVLADRLAACGRYGEALEAAYGAVHEEPLRESAHRAVVRVRLAEGDAIEARRACDVFRRLLADTLGVAPTAAMTGLLTRCPRPPGDRPVPPERPPLLPAPRR